MRCAPVPGLSLVQTGSYGGATSLFIRGGESKYAKILVDGDPGERRRRRVRSSPRSRSTTSIASRSCADRRVCSTAPTRWPASSSSSRVAVAVACAAMCRVRAGGFGSRDVDVAIRGGDPRAHYSLGAAQHRTDGFQPFNSGFRQGSRQRVARHHARHASTRSLSARFTDRELHFPTERLGRGGGQQRRAPRRSSRDGPRRRLPLHAARRTARHARLVRRARRHRRSARRPRPTQGYVYTTADRSRRRSGDVRLELALPADAQLTLGTQIERKWQESDHAKQLRRRRASRRHAAQHRRLRAAAARSRSPDRRSRSADASSTTSSSATSGPIAPRRSARVAPTHSAPRQRRHRVPRADLPRDRRERLRHRQSRAESGARAQRRRRRRAERRRAARRRCDLLRQLLPRPDRLQVLRHGAELLQRRAHAHLRARARGSRAARRTVSAPTPRSRT